MISRLGPRGTPVAPAWRYFWDSLWLDRTSTRVSDPTLEKSQIRIQPSKKPYLDPDQDPTKVLLDIIDLFIFRQQSQYN